MSHAILSTQSYTNNLFSYLKCKFNWQSCILSGNLKSDSCNPGLIKTCREHLCSHLLAAQPHCPSCLRIDKTQGGEVHWGQFCGDSILGSEVVPFLHHRGRSASCVFLSKARNMQNPRGHLQRLEGYALQGEEILILWLDRMSLISPCAHGEGETE